MEVTLTLCGRVRLVAHKALTLPTRQRENSRSSVHRDKRKVFLSLPPRQPVVCHSRAAGSECKAQPEKLAWLFECMGTPGLE
jgi:hypothetical protein